MGMSSGLDRRILMKGIALSVVIVAPKMVDDQEASAKLASAATPATRSTNVSTGNLATDRLERMRKVTARLMSSAAMCWVLSWRSAAAAARPISKRNGMLSFNGGAPMRRDRIFRMGEGAIIVYSC